MANPNAPFGFRVSNRYGGGVPNYQLTPAAIAYNDTVAIYSGDVVKQLATGFIALADPTDAGKMGIFQGCKYYNLVTKQPWWSPYWPGGSAASAQDGSVVAYVNTDPDTVYQVRSNGAALTLTDVGLNANHVNGTGNVYSGQSGAALNAASIDTTNTLGFRIVGLVDGANNDNASSYNIVEVMFNGQFQRQTTGI